MVNRDKQTAQSVAIFFGIAASVAVASEKIGSESTRVLLRSNRREEVISGGIDTGVEELEEDSATEIRRRLVAERWRRRRWIEAEAMMMDAITEIVISKLGVNDVDDAGEKVTAAAGEKVTAAGILVDSSCGGESESSSNRIPRMFSSETGT